MKKLFIEHTESTVRSAITENGRLTELIIDNVNASLVGNVIVGRIRTIMPGQFAFIDIGHGKNAFANFDHDNNYKTGQPILVQVQKDATTSKGAYVTSNIALKGRLVVLHRKPAGEIGVSHKISNEKESKRLKNIVRKLLPKGYAAIVRTNAQGCSSESIAEEITKLHNTYEEILQKAEYVLPPKKLYPSIGSPDMTPTLNDVVYDNLAEIQISATDSNFDIIKEYICELLPSMPSRIEHSKGKLFAENGITKQISNALEKETPLPCGGYITIEETEACVVVDVNTGNNTANNSYRKTILNTNLEAATAIIDQIILRNLSGIIIIDFIDMAKQEDKETLMEKLIQEAARDSLNPEILPMSKLGIVQIARPKRRLSIGRILEENCSHCSGKGKVIKQK